MSEDGKLRLGGMALRNGLLVHGPTHWAAAVRTAGGEAGPVEQQSFGQSALCRDDQGLPFWLGQLR